MSQVHLLLDQLKIKMERLITKIIAQTHQQYTAWLPYAVKKKLNVIGNRSHPRFLECDPCEQRDQ